MRILVLGDTHLPWVLWPCVESAARFADKYKPDLVIQVGDFTDQYSWSKYPKDPLAPNAGLEWQLVQEAAYKFADFFPQMKILEGNHCRRYMYRALEAGVPKQLIKRLDEEFDTQGWKFHTEPEPLVVDNIAFIHGDEMAGHAGLKSQRMGMSVVQGHDHLGYLHFTCTFYHRIFGMSVGTLMDPKSIAAKYASKNPMRCWLGWATITDGVPHLHPWRG